MPEVYPTLAEEIARRGVKKTVIARRLGISRRALYDKLAGRAGFTWREAQMINRCFFPDLDPGTLFQRGGGDGPGRGQGAGDGPGSERGGGDGQRCGQGAGDGPGRGQGAGDGPGCGQGAGDGGGGRDG